MLITKVQTPVASSELSSRIFAGELLVFSPSSMKTFLHQARAMIAEVLETDNLLQAHKSYNEKQFFAKTKELQAQFNQKNYKDIFASCLQELQLPIEKMFWDTLGLRIVPPSHSHTGGFRSHIAVHRDTWGSGLQSQINWWAPLYKITKENSFGIYPSYWKKSLKNTTNQWSFQDYLVSRKKQKTGKAAEYPSAPTALEEPKEQIKPVVIEVGELLAFSSAHLHGSMKNTTQQTRFSMEIRTLNTQDLQSGAGAPNIDCKSKPLLRLFRSISKNEALLQNIQLDYT